MILLSIPTPCHENWDHMLPNEKGAFCNACAKTVVDFTGMSDEEVKQYFLQYSGQKTCGRFNNIQLVPPQIDLPVLLSSPIPYWKKFLAVVFIAFGSLLTACSNNLQGDVAVTGDTVAVAVQPLDTSRPHSHVVGDTTIVLPTRNARSSSAKKKKCTVTMGIVNLPPDSLPTGNQ